MTQFTMYRKLFFQIFLTTLIFDINLLLFSCNTDNYDAINLTTISNNFFLEENSVIDVTYLDVFSKKIYSQQYDIQDTILLPISNSNYSPILIKVTSISNNQQTSIRFFGSFYPITSEISITGAFCSFIYLRILKGSDYSAFQSIEFLNNFNWQRFYAEIQNLENPFLLDSDKICFDICNNQFTMHSLHLPQSKEQGKIFYNE